MATLTIQPDDTTGFDTHITDGADANTNFGTSAYMRLGYRTAWGRNSRMLYKFDISGLPGGSTINSALLSVYITSADESESGDRNYGAYRITASWNETGVTWNSEPAVATVESTTYITAASTGYKAWTVTQMVTDWFNSTYTNYGTLIKNATTGQTPHFNLLSSGSASNKPKLVIDYTSETMKDIISSGIVPFPR